MKETILVLGGTGKTGKRVVKKLEKLGYNVRIGSRSANPSFDWHKPEGWKKVLKGISTVYITYQPDLAVPGALDAIEELIRQAKRTTVKKLVLLSGKGEREAELCEQVVIHSGLEYTIVRASWFNQNFSENFLLEPILNGIVTLPQSDVKIPFVDVNDIADVAVEALTQLKHNGKIYQLTGQRHITFRQAIAEISQVTEREIYFAPISIKAYSEAMIKAGISSDFVWLIEYLFTEVLGNPETAEITNDIEIVLGRKAIDFSEYVRETAKTGVWNASVTKL